MPSHLVYEMNVRLKTCPGQPTRSVRGASIKIPLLSTSADGGIDERTGTRSALPLSLTMRRFFSGLETSARDGHCAGGRRLPTAPVEQTLPQVGKRGQLRVVRRLLARHSSMPSLSVLLRTLRESGQIRLLPRSDFELIPWCEEHIAAVREKGHCGKRDGNHIVRFEDRSRQAVGQVFGGDTHSAREHHTRDLPPASHLEFPFTFRIPVREQRLLELE